MVDGTKTPGWSVNNRSKGNEPLIVMMTSTL
jgi:hypothetical protein